MFFTLARGCDGPATEMGKAEANTDPVQRDEDDEPFSTVYYPSPESSP